jgi:hypothetical protein
VSCGTCQAVAGKEVAPSVPAEMATQRRCPDCGRFIGRDDHVCPAQGGDGAGAGQRVDDYLARWQQEAAASLARMQEENPGVEVRETSAPRCYAGRDGRFLSYMLADTNQGVVRVMAEGTPGDVKYSWENTPLDDVEWAGEYEDAMPGDFLPLSGDLRWSDFTGADLPGVQFPGGDLRDVRLQSADLRGADLRGATLSQAYLWKVNLSEAKLCRADLTQANLSEADMSGADLARARLREADLCDADLTEARLCGADLQGADLSGANLTGADLSNANLRMVNLSGADLYGASLRGANLEGATMPDGAVCDAASQARLDTLHEALNGLAEVDALLEQGEIVAANDTLIALSAKRRSVLGGIQVIRDTMDAFDAEFAPRYTRVTEAVAGLLQPGDIALLERFSGDVEGEPEWLDEEDEDETGEWTAACAEVVRRGKVLYWQSSEGDVPPYRPRSPLDGEPTPPERVELWYEEESGQFMVGAAEYSLEGAYVAETRLEPGETPYWEETGKHDDVRAHVTYQGAIEDLRRRMGRGGQA